MSALKNFGWSNFDFDIDAYPSVHAWWKQWLADEMNTAYFKKISDELKVSHEELEDDFGIFPPKPLVFKALEYGPPSVVIIGQDPYPTVGNAMGLCFSAPRTQPRPKSLTTIYKELVRDGNLKAVVKHGDLTSWAEQSVMLLNTALTVREGNAGSHLGVGWQTLTDRIIARVSRDCGDGVVFLLWGAHAHAYEKLIDTKRHHVLKAGHPSPMNTSKPFVGCGHFSKTNELLVASGRQPIKWNSIEE